MTMPELDDTVHALAGLIRAAVFGNSSTTSDAEAVVARLGIGPDDPVSADAIEAALIAWRDAAVVTALKAATGAARDLAGGWERKATERREYADEKLKAGNSIPAWIAQAGASGREECARELREIIALTGTQGDHA